MAGIPQRRGDAEELGSERRAQTHLTGDAVNEITGDILDASVKIHRMFGPGMLESVYERLLALELERRGHQVGLLVNFGMATMKDGFVRVVNSKTPDLFEHNLCVSATLRDVNITKGTD